MGRGWVCRAVVAFCCLESGQSCCSPSPLLRPCFPFSQAGSAPLHLPAVALSAATSQVSRPGQGRAVASAHEYSNSYVPAVPWKAKESWCWKEVQLLRLSVPPVHQFDASVEQLTDDIGEAGAAPSAGRYLYLSQLGATLSCLIIQRAMRGAVPPVLYRACPYLPSLLPPTPAAFHVHQIPLLYRECTLCTP